MIGYDYEYFDTGLEEVESMYSEGYFDMDFPEYSEPEIPDISMPDPVISSSAPKSEDKKKKNAQKSEKKNPKSEKDEDKKPVNKKKDKDKKVEVKEDDLILDKITESVEAEESPEAESFAEETDFIEPEEPSISYNISDLEEPVIEAVEEEKEISYEVPEEPQDELEDEVEIETIPPSEAPEFNAEEAQDKVIYAEPFDEVTDIDDEEENEDKYSPILIKVLAFAAMVLVVIGLPVFLSSLGNKSRKSEDVPVVKAASTEEEYQATTTYKRYEMTENSSRFNNLDELSYYLESNINATLSNEQALYNTYISGNCSDSYYTDTLNGYIEFTDELSHLLTANKSLYKEEGLDDKYNELSEELDTLMIYGDKIR